MVANGHKGAKSPLAHAEEPSRRTRVAIACPGVGLVQRGFERLFHELFTLMRDEIDVTLFKGGGPRMEGEIPLHFVNRNGVLPKVLPVYRLFGRTPMHTECFTFRLALLPHLVRGCYDLLVCIDPPLTRFMYNLRERFNLNLRILYSHGCTMPPEDYPPADHIQHIAEEAFAETRAHGMPDDYQTLLPCGIYPERFRCAAGKSVLRAAHGVREETFVILCVAAPNRNHKRVDHLIEEATRLEGDFMIWLDGSFDHADPALIDYAHRRLGPKCKFTHVPSEKVGELYRMADLMAHCALFEAFGLVIVEGASTGLPILTHNAPHFQWLLPNPQCWVDMETPGMLAKRIKELMANPGLLEGLRFSEQTTSRFDWRNLKADYRDLFDQVAHGPRGTWDAPQRKSVEVA